MKNKLLLSIPKPCSEKWTDFTPTSTGGFCSSCSKTVVDFTTMADAEIVDFFKNKPAHSCGRFRQDQLRTYSERPAIKINPGMTLLKAGFLSLLLILISRQTFAQNTSAKPKTETAQSSGYSVRESRATDGRVVKGVVKSDGEIMPGVNVILKGSDVGTISDENGRFEFPQKLNEGDVLVFSFIGLETREFVVPKNSSDPLDVQMAVDIQMTCDTIYMTGEVAVDGAYSERSGLRGWWSKVKSRF